MEPIKPPQYPPVQQINKQNKLSLKSDEGTDFKNRAKPGGNQALKKPTNPLVDSNPITSKKGGKAKNGQYQFLLPKKTLCSKGTRISKGEKEKHRADEP